MSDDLRKRIRDLSDSPELVSPEGAKQMLSLAREVRLESFRAQIAPLLRKPISVEVGSDGSVAATWTSRFDAMGKPSDAPSRQTVFIDRFYEHSYRHRPFAIEVLGLNENNWQRLWDLEPVIRTAAESIADLAGWDLLPCTVDCVEAVPESEDLHMS